MVFGWFKSKPVEPPPPTYSPEEARRLAPVRLQAARSYLRDYLDGKSPDFSPALDLDRAASEVERARALDPDASYIGELKDGSPYTFTVDGIAAEILYHEAVYYLAQGDHYNFSIPTREQIMEWIEAGNADRYQNQFDKNKEAEAQKNYAKALQAATRLIQYEPNTPLYLRTYARANFGAKQGDKAKGHAAIRKAYEIDPNDVETVKMMP
jgi:hypothetical protein